ncbi:MAG TPA: glycoside hydrolase family 3 C-terminal domain-containing protein [Acidobacteriota bacterium]|nr:glycoside hydrolase family 3 C-terminal domain-containing protein [Acidobacteriota bacterium]
MNKIFALTAITLLLAGWASSKPRTSALLQYDGRIDAIIEQMTLEEKVNMLHGKFMFVSAGVERLGIADMKYADGPFGIREELQPNSWTPLGWENDKATFFPTGSALAATWSPELAYAYGAGLAREARLRGKDMVLAPAINIQRLPTGGRTYEYLSEDPFLSARLSVGFTRGVQDNGTAVCLKHFALNNQENNRGTVNVIVGARAMREIYLPPFRAAVEEADAYGVMAAYNKVGGDWCSENDMLLNQILRREWGFSGLVISDWGGTHSTVASITNGLNIEMPGKQYLGEALLKAAARGEVSEQLIDQRVREILRVRLAIKPVPENEANQVMTSQPAQQKIAYDVAAKSIVLLKNDGVLPLRLQNKPVIAVIGANAVQTMATGGLGAGVKTLYEITPLEGLKNRIGERALIRFAQGYEPVEYAGFGGFRRKKDPAELEKEAREKEQRAEALAREALETAAQADIVLFIGGNNRAVETEGSDRKDIFLPSGQDRLIDRIAAVNPNIVTVLASGGPNDLNVVNRVSKALVLSWFNGSEGGNALADVLLGTISPGGRLPFTLPVKLEDSPAYALGNYPQGSEAPDVFAGLVTKTGSGEQLAQEKESARKDPNTAYYSEESLVGYRWFDTRNIPVMYPFGYGLTYTAFQYDDIRTDKDSYGNNDTIAVTLTVKNTGKMTADEVVQLYVHRVNPSVEWPEKELKAFSRTTLDPDESRTIRLNVPVESLRYWNESRNAWDDDLCDIELRVGASAGDIRLKKRITLR